GFALVGAGRIGERHAGHIGSVGRLLAVCDIEKPKADKLAAPASALAFEHYDDMLEALEGRADVVSICTPNGIHADQTIKALKR
ncbi:Gfo/Idh/MocA family oxidoreductase, partial [Staphylococcus aureus]